jgi:electron transport complex protein RnfC
MAQNLGAPSKPVVKKGEAVERGTLIGEPDGFISSSIHAPTSGTVTGIERVIDSATGRQVQAVAIEPDGQDAWADGTDEPRAWERLSEDGLRAAVAAGGIVGMGGATFPTHVKLAPPRGKTIDTILINGAECEPYLTCDYRLMLERPEAILVGMRICMAATVASAGLVAIEGNKPEAVRAMRAVASTFDSTTIRVLPTKYPQGAEKQLILACLGREVPTGGLPADVGVVVQNVGTAAAIADALTRCRPLTERVVTVSGDAAARPGNFRARIGTPIAALLKKAEVADEFEKLILGGPMMGKAQFTRDLYVTKGTSGLLAFRKAAVYEHRPCIRCGACVRHCPSYLVPSRLSILGESFLDGNLEAVNAAMEAGLMDCILCGTCAYVCPSRRRIVHLVEMLRAERRKALARERARERETAAAVRT